MSQERPPQTKVWIALDRVHSLMSRRIHATMTDHDVTLPQYKVLRLLLEEGQMTANVLSGHMGVTPGNLTGVVDRLEGADLVQRQRDPQDRRCIHISLTVAGQHKAQAIIPSIRAQVQNLFSALDPAAFEAFQHSLTLLETALDTEDALSPPQTGTPQAAVS